MVLMECGCHGRAYFSAHVHLQLIFVWSMEARVSAHRGAQEGKGTSNFFSKGNLGQALCLWMGVRALGAELGAYSMRRRKLGGHSAH